MSGARDTRRAASCKVCKPCRVFGLQQSQHIVLLRRQRELSEQLIFEQPQPVVGAPHIEEHLLFERVEAYGAASGTNSLNFHEPDDRYSNNSCPDKCL